MSAVYGENALAIGFSWTFSPSRNDIGAETMARLLWNGLKRSPALTTALEYGLIPSSFRLAAFTRS